MNFILDQVMHFLEKVEALGEVQSPHKVILAILKPKGQAFHQISSTATVFIHFQNPLKTCYFYDEVN